MTILEPDQEKLREQLLNIVSAGLNAKAIAKKTKITYDILAKYKQGKLYLNPDDAVKLQSYLDKVVIP